MKSIIPPSTVAELQGPYGPLQVLEIKVQQVWGLQRCQLGRWITRSGTSLKVRSPGIWNRGAGPDFREAVIELDGEVRVGDVEIHLYREDWWRHRHDRDPRYNNVILHAVLFAGGMDRDLRTESGREPEEWVFGPWMREDVESVSGGEPGLFGELVPEIREWFESENAPAIRDRLLTGADRRWQDKESMARCLVDSAGWKGALHRMMLYYLGFPFNRRPFYEIAEAYPMETWGNGQVLAEVGDRWATAVRWGYGRPANRALFRLRQYARLNQLAPDWPSRLRCPPKALREALDLALVDSLDRAGTSTLRRQAGFPRWREWIRQAVLGGHLGSGLADRLWIDVFLPLLAFERILSGEEAVLLWFQAYPAQYPAAYNGLLQLSGIHASRGLPLCNGWIQGLLWLEDQLRLERIRSTAGDLKSGRSGRDA